MQAFKTALPQSYSFLIAATALVNEAVLGVALYSSKWGFLFLDRFASAGQTNGEQFFKRSRQSSLLSVVLCTTKTQQLFQDMLKFKPTYVLAVHVHHMN